MSHMKDFQQSRGATEGDGSTASRADTIRSVRVAAKATLLDVVRQAPALHFTTLEVRRVLDRKEAGRCLRLPDRHRWNLAATFRHAANQLNKQLRTFRIEVEHCSADTNRLTARLHGEAEWPDATKEAWSYADTPNEFQLSDPGLELLRLLRSGDLDPGFVTERSISYRIGLNGRQHRVDAYLREIVRKVSLPLRWEAIDTSYGQRPRYRIWSEAESPRSRPRQVGANPQFDVAISNHSKIDRDRTRDLIHRHLLQLSPSGADEFCLVTISSRRELKQCFPQLADGAPDAYALAEFFRGISLNPSVSLGYDLTHDAPLWMISLRPQPDWPYALKAIEEEIARPSLQASFGLSDAAAHLLEWITRLPEEDKLLGTLTPIVEDAALKSIGIKCPWPAENFHVYLDLLIEEINGRTDYRLTRCPWREYGLHKSRIRIKRFSAEIDAIVHQLQRLAEARGTTLDGNRSRSVVEALLAGA